MKGVVRPVVTATLSIVVLIGASALACQSGGSSNAAVGKYTSEADEQDYIELRSDGSFVAHEGEKTVTGKYEIRNTQITFTTGSGFKSEGTLSGSTIDRDGETFTRE